MPHLTVGYAKSAASTDDAAPLLCRVRPSHAPLRVDRVELVDVVNDPVAKAITWQRLAVVSLGGSPLPLPAPGC